MTSRRLKFIARIAENLPADLDDEAMQGWIDKPRGLQKFLLGLVPMRPTSVSGRPLDFFIRVDRSVRPAYPEGMKEVLHPALEGAGPAEYDLETLVVEWLHNGQKKGRVTGQVIYDHLKASDELPLHLGLADLLAIQRKGVAVFRKLFAGKTVFGWKSVAWRRDSRLHVPCLCEHDDKVILYWTWLDGGGWDSGDPALRFRK